MVRALAAEGLAEVDDEEAAAAWIARELSGQKPGSGLPAALEAALMACPAVSEVYADADRLRELVNDLGLTRAGSSFDPRLRTSLR